ncbi:MAG: tetratricopeptide repeat protein [Chitinispirillales bacterium]|jgi:putative GTP pyrophosphokinase|nr:tetratricopeptide repeat protein [Chitinispirillales bacterium]
MSISQYPDRKKLRDEYTSLLPCYIAALEIFQARLRTALADSDVHFTMKYRVKAFDSYYGKLLKRKTHERRTGEAIPIHDIMGTRVVCPFLDDVEVVELYLRDAFAVREIERKGAGRAFSDFGYSSTHLLLEIPEDIRDLFPDLNLRIAEVQVRTFLQDAWAEVEHELIYKNSNNITPMDEPLRRKLAALNANLSLSDDIFQEIRDYQRRLHCELNKRRYSFTAQLDEIKPGLTAAAPQTGKTVNGGKINGNKATGWRTGAEANDDDIPELVPNNKDQLLLNALNAHNEKDFPLAIRIYTKILEQGCPTNIKALVLIHRGKAYFSQSNYKDARSDFEAAAECEPANNRAFYHLGVVDRVLGDNNSAMNALQACIEINPFHVDALFAISGVYFDTGDYPGALEYCEKALLVEPEAATVKEFRKMVISRMNL